MTNELLPGITAISDALLIKKTLVISDLHFGMEKTAGLPSIALSEMKKTLNMLFKQTHATTIILNGDLKHEFGTISNQEWDNLLSFIDFLKKRAEVILIEGNHDPLLDKIAAKRQMAIKDYVLLDDIFICHGDKLFDNPDFKKAKTIIIGHLHPALLLDDGVRKEKYKCYYVGKYKRKNLIVLPSFNPFIEGSIQANEHSPYVSKQKLKKYVVAKEQLFEFS